MTATAIHQSYVYKSVPHCQIQADVHRIPGPGRQPGILWFHGGALIFGSRASIAPYQLRRYLQAGYTVVCVDYRLAPETKLEAIIEDVRDAYQWLRLEGPILFQVDPERIAVVGHSAGGYLTLMAGACFRPQPRALVSFYGYGDIIGSWYSQPDPYYCQQGAIPQDEAYQAVGHQVTAEDRSEARWRFYIYCRQHGLWPLEVAGHDPHTEADWFTPFCPVRNVTAQYPPTLLLHGDEDTDVPYEQSALMDRALEREGVEHSLLTLQKRGHGFDGPEAAERDPVVSIAFDRVLAFLQRHND